MKQLLREYIRLKKLARVMEGNLRPEVTQDFLDEVNEEVLVQLQVRKEDAQKLKRADPEKQLVILSPYLEGYLRRIAEEKISEKLHLAEAVGATIAGEAKHGSRGIELSHPDLCRLSQLHPAAFLGLQNGKNSFFFPLPKFHQVLTSLDQAKVVWDTRRNLLNIYTVEPRSKFAFMLLSQDPNLAQGKGSFLIKLSPPSRAVSFSEMLYKTVESFLSP